MLSDDEIVQKFMMMHYQILQMIKTKFTN